MDRHSENIVVQAGPGSFNDQALGILKNERPGLIDAKVVFAGEPIDVMSRAVDTNSLAFLALRNNIVPGNLIPPTVEAFRSFSVDNVFDAIRMRIIMSLIVKNGTGIEDIDLVASIKAALDQTSGFIQKRHLGMICEPSGTSEAARKLSYGSHYPRRTGVIGPDKLAEVYPGLRVASSGIENQVDPNYTLFGLLAMKKRERVITMEDASKELGEIVDRIRGSIVEDDTSFSQLMV